jgi:hypothetical protein
MIERITEQLDGKYIEEYWNRAERYWRGVWSDATGAADKMIERYISQFDGTTIVEVWDSAGKYGKSVFDKAGRLISRIGIGIPGLPGWWPPW